MPFIEHVGDGCHDIVAYRREPGFATTDSGLILSGLWGSDRNYPALEQAYIDAGPEGVIEAIRELIVAGGELVQR